MNLVWSVMVLLCCGPHLRGTVQALRASDADELFRIQLYPGHDLVLETGNNPCTRLAQYCEDLAINGTSTQECVRRHQHRVQEEILIFSDLMRQLEVDERLFLSCSDRIPVYPESDHGDFYLEMLQLLQSGPPGDVDVLRSFEARANEVRLDEREAVQLHKNAVLLHPNSTFALSRFGLVLRNFGHLELANSLWENAVQRGLWPSVLQRPEWYYVPQIAPKPWHDPWDYPFAAKLEAGFATIREELLQNLERNRQRLVTEDVANRNAVLDNQWTVIHILSPSTDIPNTNYTQYSEYFPKTLDILKNCGTDFILVKFSAIVPGTHIKAHTGPSNDRLRVHLGLVHTGGAKLRVGTEWRAWEEGKVMIFDSSWEHEVYHDGPDVRIVMIADIWLNGVL